MTIRSSDGPVGGREAVNRALNHLMAGTEVPDTRAPIGGADHKRRTTQPIAVFRVDLDHIHDDGFLRDAHRIGWRYLVDQNGPAAVADVRERPDGVAAFSRMSHGAPAERLLHAAQVAAKSYGHGVRDAYEVRILDIPSLYTSALWLHGPRDVFFPMASGVRDQGPEIREDPTFVKGVVDAARRSASSGESDIGAMGSR